jgi:hypothetical protein
MVLHSGTEERLLPGGSVSGRQGEDCILDGSRAMEFTVMPFRLCNVPATFERLMETVSRGLTYEPCFGYLDDVIVISRTFQEHLLNLRKVFQRFRESRLKLNPEKCQHFQKETEVLLGQRGKQCFLLGPPRGCITRRSEGVSRVVSRSWLKRDGKKRIRLWKEDFIYAAVTVRLLHIHCQDTTSEDWEH